jgi:hypothetical protein
MLLYTYDVPHAMARRYTMALGLTIDPLSLLHF